MPLDPWGPILGVLFEDQSSDHVLQLLTFVGLPTDFDLTKEEAYSHRTRKRAYLSRIGPIYAGLDDQEKETVATNLAKELANREATRSKLNDKLNAVGWAFVEGRLTQLPKEANDNVTVEAPDNGDRPDRQEPLEVFPDLDPSSMKRSHHYNLLDSDLQTEENVQALAVQMFQDAEAEYYYFHKQDTRPNVLLQPLGEIFWEHTENNFYQHLRERDFVKIEPREDDCYRWPWQREYIRTKPKFARFTLKLAERKRRQLDILERLHLEDFYREERMRQTFSYDVFLSFSAVDQQQADILHEKLQAAGRKIFMSCKNLMPGDDFAEQIRIALQSSKEVWILMTPNSLASEWVITEWGAAWALKKHIVPILYRSNPKDLPDRLKRLQCLDLHQIDEHIRAQTRQTSRPPHHV